MYPSVGMSSDDFPLKRPWNIYQSVDCQKSIVDLRRSVFFVCPLGFAVIFILVPWLPSTIRAIWRGVFSFTGRGGGLYTTFPSSSFLRIVGTVSFVPVS